MSGPGQGFVQVKLGGRTYPFKVIAQCRVCSHPERPRIEALLTQGAPPRTIIAGLKEDEPSITVRNIHDHRANGHVGTAVPATRHGLAQPVPPVTPPAPPTQWNPRALLSQEAQSDLLRRQHDECAICHRPITVIKAEATAERRPGHLDHDHDSGEVRGWLCANCNTGIGMLGDSPLVLASAIQYLLNPPNRVVKET